jgi:hypothetical protein
VGNLVADYSFLEYELHTVTVDRVCK